MATLCEKCLHKEVCAIRDSQEEGEEQALKFCSDFKMESVIAMKVITEIEKTINNELKNNHKVLPQVEFSNEIWNRISGRINALQGIRDFIAELKKKYTDEQKG